MICASSPVSPEDVAHHYDELDPFYREIWGEHLHHGLWMSGEENIEEAVVNLVWYAANKARIAPGVSVCDIGCGYGATARLLASERGATVSALTISQSQYTRAISQTVGAGNPRYLLGDWLKNDLPSATFDAVLSIESSEHMMDKEKFFSQAHRVLRPGGRMVVCAWLSAEKPTALQRRHLLEPICCEGHLAGMGTESDYRKWFSGAALVLQSFEDLSAQVRRTWTICLWRLLLKLVRRPPYLRFLLSRARNKVFGATMIRIWVAYSLRVMRYGVFTAQKE
jgi:tocopherol O-methyltransferase